MIYIVRVQCRGHDRVREAHRRVDLSRTHRAHPVHQGEEAEGIALVHQDEEDGVQVIAVIGAAAQVVRDIVDDDTDGCILYDGLRC